MKKGLTGRDFVRELVRKRDNYTCQNKECGLVWTVGMRRFDVHHIKDENGDLTKKYDGKEYALKKGHMITYCHKCHLNLPTERAKMLKGIAKAQAKKRC